MEPYQTPLPLELHKKGCQAFNVGQAERVSTKIEVYVAQASEDTLKHLLMGVSSSNSLYFYLRLLPTPLWRQYILSSFLLKLAGVGLPELSPK